MKEIKTGKKSESFDGPSNEPKNNKQDFPESDNIREQSDEFSFQF